jgi:cobyric acid synthase
VKSQHLSVKKCHPIKTIVSNQDFNYIKINPIKKSDWIKLNYQKKKKTSDKFKQPHQEITHVVTKKIKNFTSFSIGQETPLIVFEFFLVTYSEIISFFIIIWVAKIRQRDSLNKYRRNDLHPHGLIPFVF